MSILRFIFIWPNFFGTWHLYIFILYNFYDIFIKYILVYIINCYMVPMLRPNASWMRYPPDRGHAMNECILTWTPIKSNICNIGACMKRPSNMSMKGRPIGMSTTSLLPATPPICRLCSRTLIKHILSPYRGRYKHLPAIRNDNPPA